MSEPESPEGEREAVLRLAPTLGVAVTAAVASRLTVFVEAVYEWNRYAGLTRVPRKDAVRLHVLDSLAVAPFLDGCRRIVDLGSGGGFPGVPLALVLEDREFCLVESRSKRCSFLREVVRACGLTGRVEVLETDARRLRGKAYFDGVVSRAFLPPRELIRLGSDLLRDEGRLVVMSGGESALLPESVIPQDLPAHMELVEERAFSLPEGGERRRITVFRRKSR